MAAINSLPVALGHGTKTKCKVNEEFFEESVLPNTKYYYTFRSVDVHGHMSNPTPIYQVELIDADGAIYPLVNIYEMNSELPIDVSKNE